MSNALIKLNSRKKIAEGLLNLPRLVKQFILVFTDLICSIFCLFLAVSLRYGSLQLHLSIADLLIYSIVPIIGLYLIGFYKNVTRIFFDAQMRNVLKLFLALIVIFVILHYFNYFSHIPRSVPTLYLFLFFIWLWNGRLIIRSLLNRWQGKTSQPLNVDDNQVIDRIIIYGAGAAGKALFEAIKNIYRYEVIAFVDDDIRLANGYLYNKKIYSSEKLLTLIEELQINQVFIALPSIDRTRKKQIIDSLANVSVKIKKLPSYQEIADGKVTVSTMQRVDILDVLDRQTVKPINDLLQQDINGQSVLVTGAGGSIGSELCRQIIKNKPRQLVLYEITEFALYAIHQDLLAYQKEHIELADTQIIPILGNVLYEQKLKNIFDQYNIDTVYHAAAYKHVPIVEHNPFEGAINNIKGTYHCVKAAVESDVSTFVLVSTDKAVRPTNVMGATKRLAELLCQAYAKQGGHNTRISMVRFGNVLGSSGSVVPLFTKQIEQGGPVTVTHPEVTRYFMTIPEAANLVIQAGAMATGGEVFVLDMGKPVKIVDLARRMIHLSGFEIKDNEHPNGDIEIVYSGLRPGEKLYEELIIDGDNIEPTQHELIMQAIEHSYDLEKLCNMINKLVDMSIIDNVTWLKNELEKFVEGYKSHNI